MVLSELISCKLSTVRYQQTMFKTLTMFRGAMVTLIFDHSVALSDRSNADNAAVSHMSTGASACDGDDYGAERGRRYRGPLTVFGRNQRILGSAYRGQ